MQNQEAELLNETIDFFCIFTPAIFLLASRGTPAVPHYASNVQCPVPFGAG